MTPGRTHFARTLIALAFFFLLSLGYAHAAIGRPNAMDHRVDGLPSIQLLTTPATALVDPDRQIGARHLAEWTLPGWLFMIAAEVVALAYFWQSGGAAMLRDRLRRAIQSESLVRFCFGAALALIAQIAALIPDFYTYRIDRVMGLTNQLLRAWTGGWLVNTLIAMIVTGLVVTGVLWLVDKTHQWYIYTIFAIFALSFASAYSTPFTSSFFDHFQTIGNGRVAAVLKKEETQAGYSVPIVVQSREWRSHIGVAAVEGLGPTQRIVMSDTLLAGATLGELRYVVAVELGHIANGDPGRLALLNAIFVILGAAIAVFIADRIGFRRDDDPVSRLALVGALLGCVYLFVAPIDNSILRRMAMRADQFALGLTYDRASAVRAIVRGTDQRMDEVCPDHLAEFFLNSRPAPSERIAAINGVKNNCP